jgi:hypothetical protein
MKHPQATRLYHKTYNGSTTLVGVPTTFLKFIVEKFEKGEPVPTTDDYADEPHFLGLLKKDKALLKKFQDDPSCAPDLIRRANKEAQRKEQEQERKLRQEREEKEAEEAKRAEKLNKNRGRTRGADHNKPEGAVSSSSRGKASTSGGNQKSRGSS